MQSATSKRILRPGLVLLVLSAMLLGTAAQATERIPRILFVGDSWTGFMWGFRSLKVALENDADVGMHRWIETGSSTAIMGARSYEFLSPGRKATVAKSLADYPNIDVVVMTLGGNDFSGGFPVTFPNGTVRDDTSWYDWFRDNNDASLSNDWDEQILFSQLKNDMREILRNIMTQRPDVRVAIVGYDWTCRKSYQKVDGLTIARQNQGILKMEEAKRDLAMEPEFAGRVEYIQILGLIQNTYGYFTGNEWGETAMPTDKDYPPARPLYTDDADYVKPGVAPLPGKLVGGVYDRWPGGDPEHQDPRLAYIDQDIHLQREGYNLVAKRAFDVRIREWLNYPKALSIVFQSRLGDTATYAVTFSQAVTGVDKSDFEAFRPAEPVTAVGAVTAVESPDGGITWTVTVDLAGVSGDVRLRVLDRDTITRVDTGVPLGGPGAGNGVFAFNGVYEFQDMLSPADSDFSGALAYLDVVFQPYLAAVPVALSFSPSQFDANGSLSDGASMDDPYAIPGNSMLESYEFALISHMLNHPDLDLSGSGGPRAADVIAGWNNNILQMQTTLGGPGSIGDVLLSGMDTLFAAYMTLGDSNSTSLTGLLLMLLNGVDNFPTQVGAFDASAYIGFSEFFSRFSDPDGDGWTNEQEYSYFLPDHDPAVYAAAALDPAITPQRGDGLYEVGASVRIPLMNHPSWDWDPSRPSQFMWYRNGQLLSDGGNVLGSGTRCLVLSPLEVGDTGNYTCSYQTAGGPAGRRVYTNRTYGPVSVRVGEKLPVAAPFGLALLAGAAGLGGALALRRRRRA